MPLVLAADPGTTATKVAIINDRGRVLAEAEGPNPVLRPERGAAEHDPNALWLNLCRLSASLPVRLRSEVQAVTLAGYQLSLLALDRKHRPLTGIMTLLDGRSQETYEGFSRKLNPGRLYRSTGCPPVAQYPLAKLHWLRKSRPYIYKGASMFFGGKDWLLLKMTGRPITEAPCSSATQMLGLKTGHWHPYPLGLVGIGPDRLPAVMHPTRVAAPLTDSARRLMGLPAGTAVVPGVYDAAALLLGIGGIEPGVGAINLGTSSMFRTVIRTPRLDRTNLRRLQTYSFLPGSWLGGCGVQNAGNVRAWMAARLGVTGGADLDRLAAQAPRGADGVWVLPFWTGDRDPRIGGAAAGAILGLRERHTSAHLALAATEGVCLSLRLVRDTMRENGIRVTSIRAGGGGTASRLWTQVLADVLQSPVRLAPDPHASLTGVAMTAFVALGTYPSLAAASRRMIRPGVQLHPNRKLASVYDAAMAGFYDLIARLYAPR